jgi:hypothetical protein
MKISDSNADPAGVNFNDLFRAARHQKLHNVYNKMGAFPTYRTALVRNTGTRHTL